MIIASLYIPWLSCLNMFPPIPRNDHDFSSINTMYIFSLFFEAFVGTIWRGLTDPKWPDFNQMEEIFITNTYGEMYGDFIPVFNTFQHHT